MMNYVTGLILYKSAWRIIGSFGLKGTIKDAGMHWEWSNNSSK